MYRMDLHLRDRILNYWENLVEMMVSIQRRLSLSIVDYPGRKRQDTMSKDWLIDASLEYQIQNGGEEAIGAQDRGNFCEEKSQVFRINRTAFLVIGRR